MGVLIVLCLGVYFIFFFYFFYFFFFLGGGGGGGCWRLMYVIIFLVKFR